MLISLGTPLLSVGNFCTISETQPSFISSRYRYDKWSWNVFDICKAIKNCKICFSFTKFFFFIIDTALQYNNEKAWGDD